MPLNTFTLCALFLTTEVLLMKVQDVMTENVLVIHPGASLQEAAEMMKDNDIGSLPVCDQDRLLGMITDRDLVIRGLCEQPNHPNLKCKDVMTSPIVYCFEDQDTGDVARIMEAKKIRRVVVLNRNKRLVGIATLDNFAENQALAGEILANLTHSIHSRAA
jgi:CBS domain-containing protein